MYAGWYGLWASFKAMKSDSSLVRRLDFPELLVDEVPALFVGASRRTVEYIRNAH
jgi:hypothetical protein